MQQAKGLDRRVAGVLPGAAGSQGPDHRELCAGGHGAGKGLPLLPATHCSHPWLD